MHKYFNKRYRGLSLFVKEYKEVILTIKNKPAITAELSKLPNIIPRINDMLFVKVREVSNER